MTVPTHISPSGLASSPLRTSSVTVVAEFATTGVPHAWASMMGRPNPSVRDVCRNRSKALYISRMNRSVEPRGNGGGEK